MSFICNWCGEKFGKKYNLMRHMRRQHEINGPLAQLAAVRRPTAKCGIFLEEITSAEPAVKMHIPSLEEAHAAVDCRIILESELEPSPLARACRLLKGGVPGLLLPALRQWTREGQVELPTGSSWPPRGYASMSPQALLLEFWGEAVRLAKLEKFPINSQRALFDRYAMLALPGMDYPAVENHAQYGRDLLSLSVREVVAGRAPLDNDMTTLLGSLGMIPKSPNLLDELVECLEGVPLSLDPPAA